MKKIILFFVLALMGFTNEVLAEVRWVDSANRPCTNVCRDEGRMHPVKSGTHTGNNHEYFICAASSSGIRPGFNNEPGHSTVCNLSVGNNRTSNKTGYFCLCSSNYVRPPR